MQLSGPARNILALVDGQRTVSALVDYLLAQYIGVEREQMVHDVLQLLERLKQRGAVRVAGPELQL